MIGCYDKEWRYEVEDRTAEDNTKELEQTVETSLRLLEPVNHINSSYLLYDENKNKVSYEEWIQDGLCLLSTK